MINKEEVLEIRNKLLKSKQEKQQLETEIINTESPRKIKRLERKIKNLRRKIGQLQELYYRAQRKYMNSLEYLGNQNKGPYPLKNDKVKKILNKFAAEE